MIQRPVAINLDSWPAGAEKPEGICVLSRDGRKGYLVVYDSPEQGRIDGNVYKADWLTV
jgi:hypothetical protein